MWRSLMRTPTQTNTSCSTTASVATTRPSNHQRLLTKLLSATDGADSTDVVFKSHAPEFALRFPVLYRLKRLTMPATVWRSAMITVRIWLTKQSLHSGVCFCIMMVLNDVLDHFAVANSLVVIPDSTKMLMGHVPLKLMLVINRAL